MLNPRSCAMLIAALLGIGVASAQTQLPSDSDLGLTVRRISPRVAVVRVGPWDNSYIALATQKGIVVIDSAFSKTVARAVREAIRKEFKRSDFAYLIVSHEHSDHIFGNSAYSDLPIVGSNLMRAAVLRIKSDPAIVADRLALPKEAIVRTREALQKDPKLAQNPQIANSEKFWNVVEADYNAGVDYVPPSITFDRSVALNLGDLSVHLFSLGHWHSAADTIISVPEEHLVRLGAVLYAGQLPVIKYPYANETLTAAIIDHWIAVFNEVLAQADEKTQFVSCHGWSTMTKAQCAPQVAYMEKLWKEVRRAKAAGKTLPQTKESLAQPQFFPEVASLRNTASQVPNIHDHNIETLWSLAP